VDGLPLYYPCRWFLQMAEDRKRKVDVDLLQEPAAVWTCRAGGRWRKPDRKKLKSLTIITTEPNELVRRLHNRVPGILRKEDEEQ
jgi:putative SOS response-associated peptidase YedK